tara:strand:- start:52 stop:675 length:624 start_codon:yes stop_codon:yes gene_type:complete
LRFIKNFHIPLIALAVLISLISSFGSILSITEPLLFIKIAVVEQSTYISTFRQTYFVENEWWRLITPILLHFSFPHLAFNCLWIYILGDKIERKDGTLKFIFLVFVSGILSNFFQYYWTGSGLFGGLSGVIYGLIGYCMVIEMETKYQRYDIPPALYLFMIIWLVLGFLGILDLFGFGKVANFAHLGGLLSGVIFAMIYKNIIIKES